MADEQYHVKSLLDLDEIFPAVGTLAPNNVCRWQPLGGLARAQDTIPASSRRVVAEWSLGGAIAFAQPAGTLDPSRVDGGGIPIHDYPNDIWRRVGTYRVNVTPGCELRARVLYCPAGLVEKANNNSDGAWGKVRIASTWTTGSTQGPFYRECVMEGSTLGTYGGGEPAQGGGWWGQLRIKDIVDIRIPTFTSDPGMAVAFSEWARVELGIDFKGGARVVRVVVYEHPLSHVQAHNNTGLKSVHAMPASTAPQTMLPQIDPPDGPTYAENRFGTSQLRNVAERQSERLGPRVLHASSWKENDTNVWDQAEGNPWTITSASLIDLNGLGFSAWSPEAPGWIVAGSLAKLHRLCEPTLIAAGGGFAVVPVRVSIDCIRTGGTSGTIRVQSAPFEYIDFAVGTSRSWRTLTGYLATQVYGDHHAANVQVFASCAGGGTLSIYGISVDFGQWAPA